VYLSVRGTQSAVKSQQDRPTCVAFAVTALHEHVHDVLQASIKAAEIDLSEEYLHYYCKRHDGLGPNCTGTTVSAASVSLATEGQSLETLCPYQSSVLKPGRVSPTRAARADGKTRLLPDLRRVDRSLSSIQDFLSRSKPVLAVLDWFSNSYLAKSGLIDMPGPNDRLLGRHAVLIVEIEDETQPGKCMICFKNSWGPKWGDKGFGHFSADYFEKYGREIWGQTS
jgi:C1A family cysteine protease